MIPSTQLWCGEPELLVQKVYACATELFGQDKRDLIYARQFYGVQWFSPQKNQYSRSDLEPLFDKLSLQVLEGDRTLIILEHADTLSITCANSLLKLLEEPPLGYHFILLAQRRDLLLPTIQSRCVITEFFAQEEKQRFIMLLALFKNPTVGMQVHVMQELEKTGINEYQTKLALDELYNYWAAQYQRFLLENNDKDLRHAERMMRTVAYVAEHPPMPGSVKLFWRTLYLLMAL